MLGRFSKKSGAEYEEIVSTEVPRGGDDLSIRLERAEKERDYYKQMVEDMPVNVMACDKENFSIEYMNTSTINTLRGIEHLLPEKVDDLIGQCIDIFHKDPSHQRHLLADPNNLPHKAQIKLGDEVLELLVTAIRDRNGDYTGPMLTWNVITEQVKADAESARLLQMIDDMPMNVMMCDPGTLEITYLNKSSLETLRKIEDLLPVKADALLGQCIDIFHKDPSHQRRMLADPGNLPHKALIKLGEETLDLQVAAIRDNNDNYIGPMLTWSVVTEQVRIATNVKDVVEIVAAAATEMDATAQTMVSTAEATSQRSAAVAAASEEASTNVQLAPGEPALPLNSSES